MSGILWLFVWLGMVAATVAFTLGFVVLADRSLARGRGSSPAQTDETRSARREPREPREPEEEERDA